MCPRTTLFDKDEKRKTVIPIKDGDTWESIAENQRCSLLTLLAINGVAPTPTPRPPKPGTEIFLPVESATLFVAPNHKCTINISNGSVLWVRIDYYPDEAAADEGSLRLRSEDGTYEKTISIATNYVSNGQTIDLAFNKVNPLKRYSIDYVSKDGKAETIVSNTPFSQLKDKAFTGDDGLESSS